MKNIIVDTREQRPYEFDNFTRKKLPAGDYSIEGLETCVAIERKSLADWINTVVHSKKRFAVELDILRSYRFAAVVIEGSIADILAGDYRSEIKPAALLALTCGIMQSYSPVQIIFAGDRPHAYCITRELLKQADVKYGRF